MPNLIAEMATYLTKASLCLMVWVFSYSHSLMESLANEWDYLQSEGFLLRLLVASVCGALVGLEREVAGKPAGLRTNIMICVGSCLFTIASILSFTAIAHGAPQVDPGRITAGVVTGVGFLGAGVIIRTGLHITGITTASTIWLVSAIGIISGLGFPLLSLLVAIVAAITLFLLGKIEQAFPKSDEET